MQKKLVAIFLFLFIVGAYALTDLTPTGQETAATTQQIVCQADPNTAAGISQALSRLDAIQSTNLKTADMNAMLQDLTAAMDKKFSVFLGSEIVLLLFFSAFFFACLFLAKAKRLI